MSFMDHITPVTEADLMAAVSAATKDTSGELTQAAAVKAAALLYDAKIGEAETKASKDDQIRREIDLILSRSRITPRSGVPSADSEQAAAWRQLSNEKHALALAADAEAHKKRIDAALGIISAAAMVAVTPGTTPLQVAGALRPLVELIQDYARG